MRKFLNPRLERGEVRIEDIELDHKCRDDLSAILIGIQYLYSQEDLRERLFTLLDKYILPGTNRKVGRPGMDMWRIPVMGLLKQGLNRDYDRLHDLVNQHSDVRRFPGHAVIGDNYRYNYQTIKDNVSLLKPKLLEEVNQSVVESGHKISGKESDEILRGRCDSFVVETNVHYPTDVNLLWDALYAPRGRARRLGSLCARLVPVEKSGSPSGGGSKWFAEPGVPLHIMSMPVLPSAIRLYAALKHAFRSWPKGGSRTGR